VEPEGERVTAAGQPGSPSSIGNIESTIARDLSRKAAIVAPIVILGLGLWRGADAALAVVLAFAIVIANFLLAAWIIGWTVRKAPHALMGVVLFSFLFRLILITLIGVGIKALDIVDWPVFCITLVVTYLVLLFWELRSVSLSLAYPGLKPKPGQS
jgi:hypothetical protein